MAHVTTVRVKKTQYGTYTIHYTNPDGRRRRLSVGNDREIARKRAKMYDAWLIEGKDPELEMQKIQKQEQVQSITLGQLYPKFMEHHGRERSRKTRESYENSFRNIARCLELIKSPICSITKRMVLEYCHVRIQQDAVRGPTVNREIAFISAMLQYAVEMEFIDNNPMHGIRRFKEARKRNVQLSPSQAETLLNALPEPVANIVEFALYSGLRRENILSLRIEQVRFHESGNTADVEVTVKGGHITRIPLTDAATELLQLVIGSRQKGHVFLNPRTGRRYRCIHKTFDKAVRAVGLTVNGTKFRFHDLRHVYATWLHQNGRGLSLDALRVLMGHRDRTTTDRYATVDRQAVGAELNSLMPRLRNQSDKSKAPSHQMMRPLIGGKWQGMARS